MCDTVAFRDDWDQSLETPLRSPKLLGVERLKRARQMAPAVPAAGAWLILLKNQGTLSDIEDYSFVWNK
jgi:hypothetical protein